MTNADLSALSMTELKAIALELNTAPTTYKRSKRAWIDAIVLAQATISQAVQEPVGSIQCEGINEVLGDELLASVDLLGDCERIVEAAVNLFADLFAGDDEPWDSTDICGESAPDDDTWELVEKSVPDGSDPESGDIFGGFGDVDTWEPIGFPTVEQELVSASSSVSLKIESIASTKKGSVSVAASIVCLLIFALTVVCQVLSVSIKYGCLLVMLFGRWNPNLDIWYQPTTRTTNKGLSVA